MPRRHRTAAIGTIGSLIIVIIVLILIATGSAIILSRSSQSNSFTTSESSSFSSSSTTSETSLASSSTLQTSSSSSSTTTSSSFASSTTSSSSSTSSTTTTSTGPKNYLLQLVQAGSGPALGSSLTTPLSKIFFPADGPCCGGTQSDIISYIDNGNNWTMQGDLEPGVAWASANSSGLTLSDQTCLNPPYKSPQDCGPWHEQNGDHEEAWSTLMGFLYNIPTNSTVFSIDAYIPYHSYYQSCSFNVSSTGCSYEGSTPYDSADWALVSTGGGAYSAVVVSFAEVCNGPPPCKSNALEISAFTSAGGSSIINTLAQFTEPQYTPSHRLTIATDRKTFIDLFVDYQLIYSSTTMPIDINGTSLALNFYQFTTINNETDSTTWSNVTVFSSSSITVSGLSPGMSVVVSGPNGFSANATTSSSSSGVAVVDVAAEPLNLTVSVELNGKVIATYSNPVGAGAQLEIVTA